MFLIIFKEKESDDQQLVEACTKQENCEQVCINCKCKLRDIEDCVVSTDTVTEDTEQTAEVHEEHLEKIMEIENEEEEEANIIDGQGMESSTSNEVSIQ